MDEVKVLKHKISKVLEPIKVMLLNKRASMNRDDWFAFVEHTRHSVLNSPEQYLGPELPPNDLLHSLVTASFEEFLHDLEIRLPRHPVQ